jgi:hypothetical protein
MISHRRVLRPIVDILLDLIALILLTPRVPNGFCPSFSLIIVLVLVQHLSTLHTDLQYTLPCYRYVIFRHTLTTILCAPFFN